MDAWRWTFAVCLLLYLFLATKVHATMGRHLICKNVGEVFMDHSADYPGETHPVRGPIGKRGAKGDVGPAGRPGEPGPPGHPAVVDYAAVNETMAKMTQEVMKNLEERLAAIEHFTDRLKQGMCQIKYNDTCYWVILSSVNYYEGQTMCRCFGGKVANIYDKDHFDAVKNYLRLTMPVSASYIEPWLAINLDTATGLPMLSDGSKAPFASWFPGYPRTGLSYSTHTKVNLQVRRDATSSTQGMWNYDPAQARDGVLCEF